MAGSPTLIRENEAVRLIAYQNTWQSKQRDLLRFVQPGEWYLGTSHRNPANRIISRALLSDDATCDKILHANLTHLRHYVGIHDTRGNPGIVATDNPRSYANVHKAGHVNPKDYPSIIWRLTFPTAISHAEQRAYINNVRSWSTLIQKVTRFPLQPSGDDQLVTDSMPKVLAFGARVMAALRGSQENLQALHQFAADIQTTESTLHLALNLGLNVPLNQATITAEWGEDAWTLIRSIMKDSRRFWKNKRHADYCDSGYDGFTLYSEQTRMVALEIAPDWLLPLSQHTPDAQPADATDGLVFRPWDAATVIEQAIKTLVPRRPEHWDSANTQAELLHWLKPAILRALGFQHAHTAPPALLQLFDQLVTHLRQTYESTEAFDAAINPLLNAANQIIVAKSSNTGKFMPPQLIINQWGNTKDSLGLEPVGQLFHVDVLNHMNS